MNKEYQKFYQPNKIIVSTKIRSVDGPEKILYMIKPLELKTPGLKILLDILHKSLNIPKIAQFKQIYKI